MTTTQKNLIPVRDLTATAQVVYTAPANTKALVRAMSIHNPTNSAVVFKIWIKANGVNADNTNIVDEHVVPANRSYQCVAMLNQVIDQTKEVHALGENLTINASGVELV